jgi:hypothetical protein
MTNYQFTIKSKSIEALEELQNKISKDKKFRNNIAGMIIGVIKEEGE